jgi:hypothetical protein
MRNLYILALTAALAVSSVEFTSVHAAGVARTAVPRHVATPLVFEANVGQTSRDVTFVSRSQGRAVLLTSDAVILRGAGTDPEMRLTFAGARRNVRVTGADPLSGRVNYIIGNEPRHWLTDIPTYEKVRFAGLYDGIDLVYYGHGREIEFDLLVSPGADVRNVRMTFAGVHARLNERGDAVLGDGDRTLTLRRPQAFQQVDGARHDVSSRFVVHGGELRIDVGAYDRRAPLVIDPELVYATYLGGTGDEDPQAIAVDPTGKVYVAGTTASFDFPASGAPFDPPRGNALTAFVAKLDPTKFGPASLVYATYLGSIASTTARGVAVDVMGQAVVGGSTLFCGCPQHEFPVTPTAYQSSIVGGTDAFVTKLNAAGDGLVYSTLIGGSNAELLYAVAVNGDNIYIAGYTQSLTALPPVLFPFPTTTGAFSTTPPSESPAAMIARFDASKSGLASLVYSTFFGGNAGAVATGIAVDGSGSAYVTGYTASTDFPVRPTTGAFQPLLNGGTNTDYDAFVTKLTPDGSDLVYSTYLGGSYREDPGGITVDAAGQAYVTGRTTSIGESSNIALTGPFRPFPAMSNGASTVVVGTAAYLTKLSADGTTALYSTLFGGRIGDEAGLAVAVDGAGVASVTGFSQSQDLPVTADAAQATLRGGTDAFLAMFDTLAVGRDSLVYSTYLGGSSFENAGGGTSGIGAGVAVDATGSVTIVGSTVSSDFPVTASALQSTSGGSTDAFVAKFRACPAVPFAWTPAEDLPAPRWWFDTATRLADGKVLIVGGRRSSSGSEEGGVLYDPAADAFSATGLVERRYGHTATLLSNGKVLVAGGMNDDGVLVGDIESSNEVLYDETTDAPNRFFADTGSLAVPRAFHTATLLTNGTVLIAGGIQSKFGDFTSTAEIYDPNANGGVGGFTATGSMQHARAGHTATLLPNGTVLMVGGSDGVSALTSIEIFDPSSGVFSTLSSPLSEGRLFHRASLLPSGRVLVTGGWNANFPPSVRGIGPLGIVIDVLPGELDVALASALIVDPAANAVVPTGSMLIPRGFHTATMLANGQVLIAGGGVDASETTDDFSDTAEMFDEPSGRFLVVPHMINGRGFHTATLLANGSVFVTGGALEQSPWSASELFSSADCLPDNTDPAHLSVKPADTSTGTTPVTVTFSEVTAPGATTLTTTSVGPNPPANFVLGGDVYYHIATTATYAGSITICIDYTGTSIEGTAIRPAIGHFNSATGLWESVTVTSWNQTQNVICGTVTSLSPFALLLPIDVTPPAISIAASPASLWPPNGKAVAVTIAGRISDSQSGVDPSTAHFSVADSYGEVHPSGAVRLATDGSYRFTVSLPASRNGNDRNGRIYTVTVGAADRSGNAGVHSTTVTVPHDQR